MRWTFGRSSDDAIKAYRAELDAAEAFAGSPGAAHADADALAEELSTDTVALVEEACSLSSLECAEYTTCSPEEGAASLEAELTASATSDDQGVCSSVDSTSSVAPQLCDELKPEAEPALEAELEATAAPEARPPSCGTPSDDEAPSAPSDEGSLPSAQGPAILKTGLKLETKDALPPRKSARARKMEAKERRREAAQRLAAEQAAAAKQPFEELAVPNVLPAAPASSADSDNQMKPKNRKKNKKKKNKRAANAPLDVIPAPETQSVPAPTPLPKPKLSFLAMLHNALLRSVGGDQARLARAYASRSAAHC